MLLVFVRGNSGCNSTVIPKGPAMYEPLRGEFSKRQTMPWHIPK